MGKKTFNAILAGVIVFAGMMAAFSCQRKTNTPDPGCSPVPAGQVCPYPPCTANTDAHTCAEYPLFPSLGPNCYMVGTNGDFVCYSTSPSPSAIKAKVADVPEQSETDAPEPKPTYVAPTTDPINPETPTAGGGTGGYLPPKPTTPVHPRPTVTP